MPDWVDDASNDFIKRLPAEIRINSILLPLIKRGKNPDIPRIVRDESRKLLAAVPKNSQLVVLDVLGRSVTTMKFSSMLEDWLQQGGFLPFRRCQYWYLFNSYIYLVRPHLFQTVQ